MYKAILFDLDGTLTDSGEGIMKSVQYALEKIGKPEPDYHKLRCFVGPPLIRQFMDYAGIDEPTAREAVGYYRERYAPVGIFENELYPGIETMLKDLKYSGHYLLGVASSKPEKFVEIVLDHFGILKYFDAVVGSVMDGSRSSKREVVEEVLSRLGMSGQRESVILVGDKNYDVEGAREAGMECLAVSYGYGSLEELTEASPLRIVSSPEEVARFFRRTPLRKQGVISNFWQILYPIGIHLLFQIVAAFVFAFLGRERDLIPMTGTAAILTMIPCAIIFWDDQKRREYGRLIPSPPGERLTPGTFILLAAAGVSLALLGNVLVSLLMQLMPAKWNVDTLGEATNGESIWMMIFWVGILAPIAEETVFRWLIYLRLRDHIRVWPAVLLTSAIFSVYHLNVPQGIYAFAMGIFMAWFVEMTGSIWAGVIIHISSNCFALALGEWGAQAAQDETGAVVFGGAVLIGMILSFAIVVGTVLYMRRTGAARGYRAV